MYFVFLPFLHSCALVFVCFVLLEQCSVIYFSCHHLPLFLHLLGDEVRLLTIGFRRNVPLAVIGFLQSSHISGVIHRISILWRKCAPVFGFAWLRLDFLWGLLFLHDSIHVVVFSGDRVNTHTPSMLLKHVQDFLALLDFGWERDLRECFNALGEYFILAVDYSMEELWCLLSVDLFLADMI